MLLECRIEMSQITSIIFQAVRHLYESTHFYNPDTLFLAIPIFVLTLIIYLENVARGNKRMSQAVNPHFESTSLPKLFHSISHIARAPYFL